MPKVALATKLFSHFLPKEMYGEKKKKILRSTKFYFVHTQKFYFSVFITFGSSVSEKTCIFDDSFDRHIDFMYSQLNFISSSFQNDGLCLSSKI